jgi:hypothetical protein
MPFEPGPSRVSWSFAAVPIQRACKTCAAEAREDDEPQIQPRLRLGAIDDPAEAEAERNAALVTDGEALEEAPPQPDEDDIQMRSRLGARPPGEPPAGFGRALASAMHGGSPLPAPVRATMERSFGWDFRAVRFHDDAAAARLTDLVSARAFTHGTHVFFGAQEYQPSTRTGRHLLAHELTHVVQQRAHADGAIRRQKKKDDKKARRIGYVHFYDASGKTTGTIPFFDVDVDSIDIPDGVYEFTVSEKNKLLTFTNYKNLPRIPLKKFPWQQAKAAATMRLQITEVGTGKTPPTPPTEEGVYGEFDHQGNLVLPPNANVSPVTLPTDQPQNAKQSDAKQPGTKQPGAKQGDGKADDAKGTAKGNVPGSKYGWLGILKLPKDWIRALEAAFEAMDTDGEYRALNETIRGLAELADKRSELGATFSSGEKLLEIMLGLEENPAFDTLGTWAMAENKPAPKAGGEKLKGVLAIAKKVVRLLEKVRRIFKPIFVVRGKFQELFAGVMAMIGTLESVEELMDAGADVENLGSTKVKELIQKASTDLGGKIDASVKGVLENVKLVVDTFGDADLISYSDLARAITAAALKFMPYPFKLGVKAASLLGLDSAIADNIVAKIIPKDALDALNGVVRSLAKRVEPTVRGAMAGAGEMLTGLGTELATELPQYFESAFAQGRRRPGAPEPGDRALAHAEHSVTRSHGAPLAPDMRDDMEGALGFDVSRAQIHTDGAAAAAADALGVDAFTTGSHVYFAHGRYQPESPAGRRLLAHELTHVEQQAGAGGTVQADWKSLRRKLIAMYGKKIKEGLTLSRRGSKGDLERSGRIREWVDQKLNKPVTMKDFQTADMKAAYSLIAKGKKWVVRRKLKYMGLVPGLTIDASNASGSTLGVLGLGLLTKLASFDPDRRARAALRRSLGVCTATEQAHHIVPLELKDAPLVHAAIASQTWHMNDGGDNGVCLPTIVHSSSHPNYTRRIRQQLDAIWKEKQWPGGERDLRAMVVSERARLKKRKTKLD